MKEQKKIKNGCKYIEKESIVKEKYRFNCRKEQRKITRQMKNEN